MKARTFGALLFTASFSLAVTATAPTGCGGDECDDSISASCNPAYDPTFDNIYENTLRQSCAVAGAGCHASEGSAGNLSMASADQAYEALTGVYDGKNRAVANDPQCSLLPRRLFAPEDEGRMPKDAPPLPDGESCAIVQWIDQGSKR